MAGSGGHRIMFAGEKLLALREPLGFLNVTFRMKLDGSLNVSNNRIVDGIF